MASHCMSTEIGMEQNHRLLTAKELAERLGVSSLTVHEWARTRRIPSVRPTRKTIRFDYDAVVEAVTKDDQATGGAS